MDLGVQTAGLMLPAGMEVTLPVLELGRDYAIYATTDGRLLADLSWTGPAGETPGTTRRVGGFHVARTGEVFPYSCWDLHYRPACPDPSGMVCINGLFWADIYLLGVNHPLDGTSRAGATSPRNRKFRRSSAGMARELTTTWTGLWRKMCSRATASAVHRGRSSRCWLSA